MSDLIFSAIKYVAPPVPPVSFKHDDVMETHSSLLSLCKQTHRPPMDSPHKWPVIPACRHCWTKVELTVTWDAMMFIWRHCNAESRYFLQIQYQHVHISPYYSRGIGNCSQGKPQWCVVIIPRFMGTTIINNSRFGTLISLPLCLCRIILHSIQ